MRSRSRPIPRLWKNLRSEILHSKLDANATLSIDATLQVGAATETVEVVADAQSLQTDSAAVEKLAIGNTTQQIGRQCDLIDRCNPSGRCRYRNGGSSRRCAVAPDRFRGCGKTCDRKYYTANWTPMRPYRSMQPFRSVPLPKRWK